MTKLQYCTRIWHRFTARGARLGLAVLLSAACLPFSAGGQTLIHREGFNTRRNQCATAIHDDGAQCL